MERVATKVPGLEEGTGSYSKTLKFFRACWESQGKPQATSEVEGLEVKDTQCEEYCELVPEYRRKQLDKLNKARQYEVEDARLPSARLWGRYERLKRRDSEFHPLFPEKVQSEEVGKRKPAVSLLAPVQNGGVGDLDVRGREPAVPGGLVQEHADA